MAVTYIYNKETDPNGNQMRTFYMDSGDATTDLPTNADGKTFGIAHQGETAFSAENKTYTYFVNAGWVEKT